MASEMDNTLEQRARNARTEVLAIGHLDSAADLLQWVDDGMKENSAMLGDDR